MDWGIFFTIIGSASAIIGFVYQFLRNVKSDLHEMIEIHEKKLESFEKKFETLDNRIFQLAMGRSLKEILKEEKKEL